ncbi:MAG: carboxypeptidase-like regulatory domain-containing protein, partial [Blastocatellia bacterium]
MRYLRQSIILILLCGLTAAAQNITGVILGTVTDMSGGVITGASVTITSLATNQTTVVTSGADGSFQAPLLPPGN